MARYLDGSPVVHGPFGGDDLQPWEVRMMTTRRRWWDRLTWWSR